MNYTLTWDVGPEDVLVTTDGKVGGRSRGSLAEIVGDARFRPDLLVLIDHRLADLTGFTWDDLAERADGIDAAVENASKLKIATVVSETIDFGIARTYEALTGSRADAEVFVTYSIDEAREWLREHRRRRPQTASG